jgi:hypothetical protein
MRVLVNFHLTIRIIRLNRYIPFITSIGDSSQVIISIVKA